MRWSVEVWSYIGQMKTLKSIQWYAWYTKKWIYPFVVLQKTEAILPYKYTCAII